ncbi:MAG: prephenate dehydratase [Eggerthellaceae bacterium]|nr:prephenate dehydratase [Eggerthellaceae bacterium]
MTSEQTIAFLGPTGTYSDEACRLFSAKLGFSDPQYTACSSFDEIFDSVERGKCAYGVVPTENSLEGPVTAVLDNFASRNTESIVGEEVLSIHHSLLLHPEAALGDVTTVASHAQGLAQCRRYIDKNLIGRKLLTTSSTAESARLAAEDQHVAGIASVFAANLYGAAVYEQEIEDHLGNQTSFALITHQGGKPPFTGERYKTSLALFLQADKAGALLMILSEFGYANINLTKIHSRPTKQALGDYMFFIDIEGSTDDAHVQTALNCLRLKLREVKVLGSYPVS